MATVDSTPKRVRVTLVLALFLTLATATSDSDCNACYGRGHLAYQSAYLCRCTCSKNETISNGIVSILEFLPPNCRYTSAQVYRALATVQTKLSSFSFVDFTNTVIYNLGLNATASLHLVSLGNTSSKVLVDFEFRDEGLSTNNYQAAQYDYLLFASEVSSQAPWTVTAGIQSVVPVRVEPASAQSVSTLFSISGYPIATETVIVVVVVFFVCFGIIVMDLMATTNIYKNDEEAKAALEEFQRAKFYGAQNQYAPTDDVENPHENAVSPTASPPHPEPRTAWPDPDDSNDEAAKQPIRRQSTSKNMKDYSKKFYANA